MLRLQFGNLYIVDGFEILPYRLVASDGGLPHLGTMAINPPLIQILKLDALVCLFNCLLQ